MTQVWPPKDYMQIMEIVTIFVKEREAASISLFKERLGMSKSTVNRYLRILRDVFGMKIYFVRRGNGGNYVIEDFGCFDERWFEHRPAVEPGQEPEGELEITDPDPNLKVPPGLPKL